MVSYQPHVLRYILARVEAPLPRGKPRVRLKMVGHHLTNRCSVVLSFYFLLSLFIIPGCGYHYLHNVYPAIILSQSPVRLAEIGLEKAPVTLASFPMVSSARFHNTYCGNQNCVGGRVRIWVNIYFTLH